MSLIKTDDPYRKRYCGLHRPIEFPFECYERDYHPTEIEDGKMYFASSYMVAGKLNRLIEFPFAMSILNFRLMFRNNFKSIYFYGKEGSIYEYFTGNRLDVLSYNYLYNINPGIIDEGLEIMVLSGETNETLKNKGVKRPFVHDLDLHTIEEDEFEKRISIWENNRKSVLTFKDEFNSFCKKTRNSLTHDVYTLRRPQ